MMNSLKVENIGGKYHELHHSECRTREVQAAIESKLLNIWHFSWFCTTFWNYARFFFICFSSELGAWKEIYHNNYVSVSFPFSIIKTSWAESGNGKRYLHFSAQRIRNSIFALSSTPLPLPTVIALRRKQSKDINFKSIFFFWMVFRH